MISALRSFVLSAVVLCGTCSAQESIRSLAAKIDEYAAKEQIKLGLDSRLRAAERIAVVDPVAAKQLLDNALPSIVAVGGGSFFAYRWTITYARIDIDAAERAATAIPIHNWTYTALIEQSWHLRDHDRAMRLMRAARHEGYYSLGASFQAVTGMVEPYRTQGFREFLDEFPIATATPGDVRQLLRLANARPPKDFTIPALQKILMALNRADFDKSEPGWDYLGKYEFDGRVFHTATQQEALLMQSATLFARVDPPAFVERAAVMPEWWPLLATISPQERAMILRTEPMMTQRPPPREKRQPLPDVSKLSYDEAVAVAIAMPGASGFPLLISLRSRGLTEEQKLTDFRARLKIQLREESPWDYYAANSLLIEAGKPEMKTVYAEAVNAYLAACEKLAVTETLQTDSLVEREVSNRLINLGKAFRERDFALPQPHPSIAARQLLTDLDRVASLANSDFTLKSTDGITYALSQLKGKIVLIDFWATWCPPCREAVPFLEKLHRELEAQGVVILGIGDEVENTIESYRIARDITYPTLEDADRRVHNLFGVDGSIQGIPTSFVFDRNGKFVEKVPYPHDEEGFRAALKRAGL